MAGEIHFSFLVDRNNLTQSLNDVDNSVTNLVDKLNGLGQAVETPLETSKRAMEELDKSIAETNEELAEAKDILMQFERNAKKANDEVANFQGIKVDDTTGKLTEEYVALTQKASEMNAVFAEQQVRVQELEAQEKGLVQSKDKIAKSTEEAKKRIKEQNGVFVSALGGSEKYTTIMQGLDNATYGAVGRFQSLVKASKAFIATPLGAVLTVIVGLFKAVQTYFNSSSEGQEKLAYATGLLEGVMIGLKDVVIAVGKAFTSFTDSVTETAKKLPEMWDAFKENPLDYVKQAWNGIANYFMNAGTQLVDYMTNLGKTIWNAMRLDFDKAGESFRLASEAFTGMLTGNTTEEIHKAVDSTIEAGKKEVEHQKEISKKKAQINLEARKLSLDRAKWAVEAADIEAKIAEEQVEMYSGTTASRVKASEEMMKLSKKKFDQEIAFAEKELELHKRTMTLGDNGDDDYKKLWELEANVNKLKASANAQLAGITRRATSMRKALLKEETEAELATMRDGEEKTMKQRKLQEQMELAEIEEAKQRYIDKVKKTELEKAQAQAKARGEAFNAVDWEYEFNRTMDEEGSDANKALSGIDIYTKDAQRVTDKYAFEAKMQAEQAFAEFRSFSDRMLLIREEYAQKIKVANEMGESSSVIAGLRLEEQQQMDALRGDMNTYYSEYIQLTLEHQKELKEIQEGVTRGEYSQDVANALIHEAESEFNNNLQSKGYNTKELERDLDAMNSILEDYAEASMEAIAEEYENALSQLATTAKNTDEYMKLEQKVNALKQMLHNSIEKANEYGTPTEQQLEKWEQFGGALNDCIDTSNELAETLGGVAGESLKLVNTLASFATQMINQISQLIKITATDIKSTVGISVEAIKTMERASVILAIIGIAIGLAQQIYSMFKDKDNMEEIEANLDKFKEKIEEMKKSMRLDSNKNDTIFDKFAWQDMVDAGMNATNALETFVEKSKTLYEDIIEKYKDNRFFHGVSETFASMREEMLSSLTDVSSALSAFGTTIENFKIKTKEVSGLKKAFGGKDTWKSLSDLGYDFYTDGQLDMNKVKEFTADSNFQKLAKDQQKYIKDMVSSWDEYEKSMEQLRDSLSSIFGNLGSSLGDAIENAFYNGIDSAKDYKTAVGDMLNDMAKDFIIANKFQSMFKDAQDEIEELYKGDGSEEDKIQRSVAIMTKLGDDAMAEVESATEMYGAFMESLKQAGYETSASIEEQETKYGGYETMSEETGTELSGRFSAMQILQSQQVDLSREMYDVISNNVALVNNINVTLGSISFIQSQQLTTQENILNVLRTYTTDASSSLANIAKYTRNLE